MLTETNLGRREFNRSGCRIVFVPGESLPWRPFNLMGVKIGEFATEAEAQEEIDTRVGPPPPPEKATVRRLPPRRREVPDHSPDAVRTNGGNHGPTNGTNRADHDERGRAGRADAGADRADASGAPSRRPDDQEREAGLGVASHRRNGRNGSAGGPAVACGTEGGAQAPAERSEGESLTTRPERTLDQYLEALTALSKVKAVGVRHVAWRMFGGFRVPMMAATVELALEELVALGRAERSGLPGHYRARSGKAAVVEVKTEEARPRPAPAPAPAPDPDTDTESLDGYLEALLFAAPRLPCRPEMVRRIVWGASGHKGRAATEMALDELVAQGLADRDLTGRYRARALPEKAAPTEGWRERLDAVEKAVEASAPVVQELGPARDCGPYPSAAPQPVGSVPDEDITDAADTEPPGSLLDALVCPGCGARTIEPCDPGCTVLDEPIDDEEPAEETGTAPFHDVSRKDNNSLAEELSTDVAPDSVRGRILSDGMAAFRAALGPVLCAAGGVTPEPEPAAPPGSSTVELRGFRWEERLSGNGFRLVRNADGWVGGFVRKSGSVWAYAVNCGEPLKNYEPSAETAQERLVLVLFERAPKHPPVAAPARTIADLAAKYADGPLAVISRAQKTLASLPGLRPQVAAAIEQLRHALAGAEALLEDLDRMGGVA